MPAFTFEKLSSPAPRVPTPRPPESNSDIANPDAATPPGIMRRMLGRLTTRGRAARRGGVSKSKQAG